MTKTTTDGPPTFRVYIGSGGSSSATAKRMARVLRSNGVEVTKAKSIVDDLAETKEAMFGANVAVIVLESNPLALVEGGFFLGCHSAGLEGAGCLWVKEDGCEATPLSSSPMTSDQALSALAEMVAGYHAKLESGDESE